jgi:hypothetical protein
MALERGFRRIIIVLSVVIFALGVGFDVITLPARPVSAIVVTLTDGRHVTLHDVPRDAVPARAEQAIIDNLAEILAADAKAFDPKKLDNDTCRALDHYSSLASKIIDIPGFDTTGPPNDRATPPGFRPFLVQWDTIRRVEVLQSGPGRMLWWWGHAHVTPWLAALVAFLWLTFYTVRWIVRGFARP